MKTSPTPTNVATQITNALDTGDWDHLGRLWAPTMARITNGQPLELDPDHLIRALHARYTQGHQPSTTKINDELDTLLTAALGSGCTDDALLGLPVGFFFATNKRGTTQNQNEGTGNRIGRLFNSDLRNHLSRRCLDELTIMYALARMGKRRTLDRLNPNTPAREAFRPHINRYLTGNTTNDAPDWAYRIGATIMNRYAVVHGTGTAEELMAQFWQAGNQGACTNVDDAAAIAAAIIDKHLDVPGALAVFTGF